MDGGATPTGGDAAALRLAPLVQAAAGGDVRAFGRLVEETQGLVRAITLAVTRDPAASDDVAQEVYLDAWRGLTRLRAATSFLPWLRALARNHARMAVRGAVRRRARVAALDAAADPVLAAAADPSPDALTGLLDAEARAALAAALDAVPDAAREVLVLYYREGRSVRQVAELLGLRDEAVKQRLARARRTLRDAYLARTGELLGRAAPGAAFAAAVTGALASAALVGAPGAAAAAVLAGGATAGSGSAAGAVAKGSAAAAGPLGATWAAIGALTAGAAAGVLAGLAGGVLGLVGGARGLWREARDAAERRAVIRYVVAVLAAMLLFLAVIVHEGGRAGGPRPLPVTLAYALMLAVCAWQHRRALPRARAPRLALERAADPVGSAARERRRARTATLGLAAGGAVGALPIVWLWLRG